MTEKSKTAETPENDPREQEWQELDDKEILMGVLTELQQIRLLLQGAENGHEGTSESVYECTKCGTQVKKDERRDHAISSHKAPPDMVDGIFKEV